jgi:glycerol-3-phosphate dehydrogenase
VVGAYAGLRPLLEVPGRSGTADVSRRHALFTSPDGVITIVGGKLTTYRQMAEDAVDAAIRHRGLTAAASPTRRLPLVGAGDRADLARLAARYGHLVARYGTEAPEVAALAEADPRLAEPIAPGVETIGAELAWGVRHEGATCVEDLLDRRSRVGPRPHRPARGPYDGGGRPCRAPDDAYQRLTPQATEAHERSTAGSDAATT